MSAMRAFWDASAVVPLCFPQSTTALSHRLRREYRQLVVWWGTVVEVRATLARLARDGSLSDQKLAASLADLALLHETWREVLPTERVRDLAETLTDRYPLRAGHAFQLVAALVWCNQHPRGQPFVCFDRRLAQAAAEAGFTVLPERG